MERKEILSSRAEIEDIDINPQTVSVRGMTEAVEQRLEDQLLPPIYKELRKEWKKLRKYRSQ
jgi:hypothetical protein